MRRKWELSRRTFLRGAGFTLGLPMLEAMLPSIARAQAAGVRKPRVIFFYAPMGWGHDASRFFPSALGANWPTSFALNSLNNHRDRVWVLDNIQLGQSWNGSAHSAAASSWLTNSP